MGKAVVTRHGEKRVKERIGLSKKSVQKNAGKALLEGITHSEAKGSLSKYLDGIYLLKRCSNNMRVYNRMVYLFRGNILMTVLLLPQRYQAYADKLQKRKRKLEDN